jgi:hypothetical protein
MQDSDRMDPMLKALLISFSVFVFGMLASNESIRMSILYPFTTL